MKVITINEPYASLILEGKKTIETRVWKTKYRGEIYLHCSKKPESPLSGKIFAKAILVDCKKMKKEDEEKAMCPVYLKANSWFLKDIVELEDKIEVKGKLSLWEYPDAKIPLSCMQ